MIACVLMFLPGIARAELLTFSGDPNATSCYMSSSASLVKVYVFVKFSAGARGVAFAAPLPPNTGLTYLAEYSAWTLSGNSQTGVAVDFGGCQYGTIPVMEIWYGRISTGDPCIYYYPIAHPQDGLTFTDCSLVQKQVVRGGGILNSIGDCNYPPAPMNPSPPDEATDVAATVDLSWLDLGDLCGQLVAASAATYETSQLYFGTSANPPYIGTFDSPHTVGPLLPATTYYWRVINDTWYIPGPVWSFTTAPILAAHQSTWGAVKALYR